MIIHMKKSMKYKKGVIIMTLLRWTFIKKSMLLINIVNPVNDAEDIESPQNKPRNYENGIVDYDSQLDLNIDTKGPKINDKVDGVVNKLCLQRISQDQSEAMIKHHSTPQN